MGKEKKKHKKTRSHSYDKKTKRRKFNSTHDSSSYEEEWVEVNVENLQNRKKREDNIHNKIENTRNDWLTDPTLFPCISHQKVHEKKEKRNVKDVDKFMLYKLGQTERELNPYWKDGGNGLPQETKMAPESLRKASVTVGVAWLRKALQRSKEQAMEQRRPLEQVVAEQWGSLEKLERMIAEPECHEHNISNSKQQNISKHKSNYATLRDHQSDRDSERRKTYHHDRHIYRYSEKLRKTFRKPDESEYYRYSEDKLKKDQHKVKHVGSQNRKKFMNPCELESDEEDKKLKKYTRREKDSRNKHSSKERVSFSASSEFSEESLIKKHNKRKKSHFRKTRDDSSYFSTSSETSNSTEEDLSHNKKKDKKEVSVESDESDAATNPYHRLLENKNTHSTGKGWRKKTEPPRHINTNDQKVGQQTIFTDPVEDKQSDTTEKVLSDKEMNDLGAKLVKAELLGNKELADELKAKLEGAREAKANQPKESQSLKEVVVLTHTDARGFSRPVSLSGKMEPTCRRRKGKRVETHSDGKRIRFFADDDKYSLQEMFQREKLSTVEDSNAAFAKLASKGIGHDGSARDMEDVFEETACVEKTDGRRERQHAIEHSKRTARSLDNCQWCVESKQMIKHLIVAMGKTCYLCVPPYQSLTANHCLLVPSYHTPSATHLDEDVWAEMQDFRKSVVQMFQSEGEDVVFFESARYLNKFPHMVLNCVPMLKETGDLAPIYFKKAIQECEMEWSNNKKLVELEGKDVRKAMPRGLPYFAVDFGMESGFAHVIEDEKLFPQSFAQEIIGGMLDLDHTIWRKQRKQTFEEQSRKVIQLTKLWKLFDCTKKTECKY